MKSSINLFQLIFLVISSLLQRRSGTLVYGLIVIFFFSRHVQNICKSCFAQIPDLKRLRGYLTPHAALMAVNALVKLTTVSLCLGISQLLIIVSCNVFKIVWLELLPTPLSIRTSHLL